MVYNMSLYVHGPKTGLEKPGEDSGLLALLYRVSWKWKLLFPLLGNSNMLARCIEISSFPLCCE